MKLHLLSFALFTFFGTNLLGDNTAIVSEPKTIYTKAQKPLKCEHCMAYFGLQASYLEHTKDHLIKEHHAKIEASQSHNENGESYYVVVYVTQ